MSDALDSEEFKAQTRPSVAEFPISEQHYAELQEQRAEMYAEYMNKIVEATQTAYDHIALMDILKK